MNDRPQFDGLPRGLPALAELMTYPQWVSWKIEERNGKATKPPVSPKTGFGASHSKPETWGTYEQAAQLSARRKLPGVGFVLSEADEFVGIDLDDCIDDEGQPANWAQEIIDLSETYCEVSPSGHGLRLIARGQIDRAIKRDSAGVEVYRDRRYLTITGQHWPGTPEAINPAPRTLAALQTRIAELETAEEGATTLTSSLFSGTEDRSLEELRELLSFIPASCGYHDWLSVLMAIHAETNGSDAGFLLADGWSSTGSNYGGPNEIHTKWRSFRGDGITANTIAEMARQNGADLAEIGMRHKGLTVSYDKSEAATVSRQLLENHDGTLADAETGEVVDPTPAQTADENTTLDYPPGLVGDIARWIVATARRPQPELAIGAALTIVGTLAGRQFAGPTKSGTHLYFLGLAPTSAGKDHALQQISRLMAAAKLAHHLGPSEFISMPAVVNFISRKPLAVCPMDEFGAFMKRINSRRASGFEGAISKVIRTLWSSSFAPYHTPEWAQKESQSIYSPAISLYGASTPEQFYSAMEGASLEDGTLNRFLLVSGRQHVDEVDPEFDAAQVPDELINDMHLIYYRSGDLAGTYRNDAHADPAQGNQLRKIDWCPDGSQQQYREFSKEMVDLVRNDPDFGACYARSAEMAVRIATIISIGRLEDDQVRVSDLKFGVQLARQSAGMMAHGAEFYMADNENQANAQRILRLVKKHGGRIKHRDLLYGLRHSIRARDLRDLIAHLCEAGHLEKQQATSTGGRPSVWYKC